MISIGQIHPQLAFSFRRDYFFRPDSSPACSFSPQGLLLPPGFISILLFLPQGLFPPPGFIPDLLFCAAGMISSAQMHLYLALLCCRDDFFCSDASPACFFLPQGLLLPPGFISILLFSSTGIIATARIHLYLALLCRRDDFFCADASPACFFVPQGLLRPPGFIPSLLFFTTGIISIVQIHLYLALFLRRDYFRRPDSSPACFFVPQGLFRPPGFILILLFFSTGIIATARIHPQLAFFTTGIISAAWIHPYLALFFRRDYF